MTRLFDWASANPGGFTLLALPCVLSACLVFLLLSFALLGVKIDVSGSGKDGKS